MTAAPPSPAEMLAAASKWKRRAKRRSQDKWRPFIPLAEKLYAEGWSAKEAADQCLSEKWIASTDYQAFHRWLCRQFETLRAGGTLTAA
jgi:hypothetical protein